MRPIHRSAAEALRQEKLPMTQRDQKRILHSIIQIMLSGAFLLAGLIYGYFHPEQDLVRGLVFLPGVLAIGLPITLTGIRGFLQQDNAASMELLVTIAMLLSVLNNQYVVAILIPLLLTLVHFFEEKSIIGSREAMESLKSMQASRAILLHEGKTIEVHPQELSLGQLLIVYPGSVFPVDGIVTDGASSVNQQSLTGEAIPRTVSIGSKVYAGTINLTAVLTVQVERRFEDTSFQQVMRLLDETEKTNNADTRLVNQVLAYYIPLTLILALVVWMLTRDINRAVVILVVSCPCGHMLIGSAPLIAALSAASKRGILIKNAAFIEKLSTVDTFMFDKTGTLTHGELKIDALNMAEGQTEEAFMSLAKGLAMHSLHPVSQAIMRKELGTAIEGITVKEQGGLGLIGSKDSLSYLLGSASLMRQHGLCAAAFPEDGCIHVYLSDQKQVLGRISLTDTPRQEAKEVIEGLHALGIENMVMLTGDEQTSANRLGQSLGLHRVYARLMPDEKQRIVKEYQQNHRVVFVGDGINDAPSLSAADIGIAMGAFGTDAAIQSADIALMNSDLNNIIYALRLALKAKTIIRQNLIIAFCSSLIMIILAGLGWISALPGAVLHNIGAFIVLLNSARLLSNEKMLPSIPEKEEKSETKNINNIK
ncbi:MAG: heavy metal translocating P-type ATPase [Christensenellales bacterium]|jgi:Cd2+/Zn2+-exporting ATPase